MSSKKERLMGELADMIAALERQNISLDRLSDHQRVEWANVSDALDGVAPGWFDGPGTSGELAAAAIRSLAASMVGHERYCDGQCTAWETVMGALDAVSPGWVDADGAGTGAELAAHAIRKLAARSAPVVTVAMVKDLVDNWHTRAGLVTVQSSKVRDELELHLQAALTEVLAHHCGEPAESEPEPEPLKVGDSVMWGRFAPWDVIGKVQTVWSGTGKISASFAGAIVTDDAEHFARVN